MPLACPSPSDPHYSAYKALEDKYGEDLAMQIFYRNAQEIPIYTEPEEEGPSADSTEVDKAPAFDVGRTVSIELEKRKIDGEFSELVEGENKVKDLFSLLDYTKDPSKKLPSNAIRLVTMAAKGNPVLSSLIKNIEKLNGYEEFQPEMPSPQRKYFYAAELFKQQALEGLRYPDESRQRLIANAWNSVKKEGFSKLGQINASKLAYDLEDHITDESLLETLKIAREGDYKGYKYFADQKWVEDSLLRTHNNTRLEEDDSHEVHDYYYIDSDGNEVKSVKTVSDRGSKVDAGRLTDTQKLKGEKVSKHGTNVHQALENIIKVEFNGDNSVSYDADIKQIGLPTHNRLKRYAKDFIRQFPPNTKFIPELRVFDPVTKEAGSVDLVAVLPNGQIEIFDWKAQDISQSTKDAGTLPYFKQKNYEAQLEGYKQLITKQLGEANFGKVRVIPIQLNMDIIKDENDQIKDWRLKGVAMGSYSRKESGEVVAAADKEYLDPVPISSETTGNEVLDDLLEELQTIQDSISKNKESDDVSSRNERIKQIAKSIRTIRNKKSLADLLDQAKADLKRVKDLLDSDFSLDNINSTVEEIQESQDLVKFYQSLQNLAFDESAKLLSEKDLKDIDVVQKEALNLSNKLEGLRKKVAVTLASENQVESSSEAELFEYKEMGFWQKNFGQLSQMQNKMMQILYKLIRKSKEDTKFRTENLMVEIEDKMKPLKEWAKARGLSGIDMFDILLDKESGRRTGRLLRRWNPEYFTKRDAALASKNYTWVADNTVFDEASYTARFEEVKKIIKNYTYSSDTKANTAIQNKKIAEFEATHKPVLAGKSNPRALLNKKNRFLSPKEEWSSEGYNTLNLSENAPALEFYKFFTGKMKELTKDLPVNMREYSIPNIEKNLVESIFEGTSFSDINRSNMSYSVMDKITYNSRAGENHLDVDGNPKHTVPLFYSYDLSTSPDYTTRQVETAERKSYDLGKVLAMYGRMAYNYENMNNIDNSVKMLRRTLADSKQIQTKSDGAPVMKSLSNTFLKKLTSADTLEVFDDFVNAELYGITRKGKEFTFSKKAKIRRKDKDGKYVVDPKTGDYVYDEIDKEFSVDRAVSQGMRMFSIYTLSFNTVSIIANFMGGGMNLFIQGSRGRFFNKKHLFNSVRMLTSNSKVAGEALKHLDIVGEQFLEDRIKNLSATGGVRNLKNNHWFLGQHKGDEAIQSTIQLSLMQSHTINDNGQVVKLKGEGKSIIDMLNEGKTIEDLMPRKSTAYMEMRAMTHALAERILGLSSRQETSRYKLFLFGKILGHFRSWIPRTAQERFGGLTYNQDLKTWEKGRYSSMWKQLTFKTIPRNLAYLVTGLGSNAEARGKELYMQAIEKNPSLASEMSEDEFVELHIENIKATISELRISLTFVIGVLTMVQPDDDDSPEEKYVKAKLLTHLNRAYDEISFYHNPASFTDLVRSPIPAVGLFENIWSTLAETSKQAAGVITMDEQLMEDATPLEEVLSFGPGIRQIPYWMEED